MSDKTADYKRVQGVKLTPKLQVLDRTAPFDGRCEMCSAQADLRPYGPAGEWICCPCGMKDQAMTEKRMGQVLFGNKPDA